MRSDCDTSSGAEIDRGLGELRRGEQFPTWEIVLPKQDFVRGCEEQSEDGPVGTSTRIRKSRHEARDEDWPAACINRKMQTHSDRRLSQVRERGGRGLLKDECRSFPPASEREARMDDPTPRSKKDRETECVDRGLLFPSKGLHFF
jgi:hypothetical protein